jgi:hypothetical protein
MRRLLLMTAVMVLFGCGTSLAQVGGAPSAMPQVSPPPAGSPGSALGAIQPSVTSPVPNSGIGTISQCAANGGDVTADFPVDATDASASVSPGFDASEASTNCGAASPPPTSGLVSPPDFASGAIPLGSTEAGGSGLSPLIAGPFPQPPPTCSGDTAASGMTSAPTSSELTSDPMSMSSSC